jgi:hypothetical protein
MLAEAGDRSSVSDETTRVGIPYWRGGPMRCCFITDDTHRYSVLVCGEPVAWPGCQIRPAA